MLLVSGFENGIDFENINYLTDQKEMFLDLMIPSIIVNEERFICLSKPKLNKRKYYYNLRNLKVDKLIFRFF